MKNDGVTLMELLVVISIIGILVVALGLDFAGWRGSYEVEGETKDLYGAMMDARARAMTRKRVHFVTVMNVRRYAVMEDLNPWPDGDAQFTAADTTRPSGYTEPIPLLQRTVDHDIKVIGSSTLPMTFVFDTRGLIFPQRSIRFEAPDTDGDGEPDFKSDYDCITITQARIRTGQYKKTPSEECVEK